MHADTRFSRKVLIGVIAMAVMSAAATVGIKGALGQYADIYNLKATFDRTGHNLDAFSSVKIRGVSVGNVGSVRLLRDGRAEVTLRINNGVKIADTAVASVEPLSIFGPQYLKLDPGAHEKSGPFLRPGARIAETRPPTELTDIIGRAAGLLDAIDPTDLSTVVHNLAEGVDGLGPAMGRSIDNGAKLFEMLARHNGDTRQLLVDLRRLAAALADKGDELLATARDANAVLPDLSSRSENLGRLLDSTSRLSSDLAAFVNGHSPAIDRSIAGLSAVVSPIYRQLNALPDFQRALNEFFYGIGEVFLRLRGPDGHLIGVLEGSQPADLCQLLVGAGCVTPSGGP